MQQINEKTANETEVNVKFNKINAQLVCDIMFKFITIAWLAEN